MNTYGIGGEERKANNAAEAISDIPLNRTLFVEKLTFDPAYKPEVVHDLKNINEVFQNYQPQVEMEFETEEGSSVNEVLHFQSLSHFGKQGIIAQSPFLQNLNAEVNDLQKIIKQFKSNKILKTVLENPDAKENYLSALKALVQELEEAESTL
jgi:predicted component of type VI protein secretion system